MILFSMSWISNNNIINNTIVYHLISFNNYPTGSEIFIIDIMRPTEMNIILIY